jgi:hypothetical protein
MPHVSKFDGARKPEAGCALSNRTRLFLEAGFDRRSIYARRLRDLLEGFIADGGGWDHVSESYAALSRRAAILTLEAEKLESQLAKSETSDTQLALTYTTITNTLRRVIADIGLHHRRAASIAADLNAITGGAQNNAPATVSEPSEAI